MPKETPHAYKKVNVRKYPPQGEVTLTVCGQVDPPTREVTITIENAESGNVSSLKVDAAVYRRIMQAIEWIKRRELPKSSKNIIQQIRFEEAGFVVMREIQPYESAAQITEQYKIGDGHKCNYSFSSDAELEDFFKQLGSSGN